MGLINIRAELNDFAYDQVGEIGSTVIRVTLNDGEVAFFEPLRGGETLSGRWRMCPESIPEYLKLFPHTFVSPMLCSPGYNLTLIIHGGEINHGQLFSSQKKVFILDPVQREYVRMSTITRRLR